MTNLSKIFTVGAVLDFKEKSKKPAVKKKWYGSWPAKCDVCKAELSDEDKFYDAKVPNGPWGLLCGGCFRSLGCTLGTGCGQEYDAKTLEKTGG